MLLERNSSNIPVPIVRKIVNNENNYLNQKQPDCYITFKSLLSQNLNKKNEQTYDMDELDETWLCSFNSEQRQLDPEIFEKMIIILEKAYKKVEANSIKV